MGAELYYYTTAYTSDPNDALESLQTLRLDRYDLPKMVASNVTSCEQAFVDTPEGDEFGLHEHYKTDLERARTIASEPIPTDFAGRLNLVRRLHYGTGQGIGNILDVEGVAGSVGARWCSAKPLAPVEVISKFGTDKLLTAEAGQYADAANEWLGRGECVCFPLYNALGDEEPIEWCFVLNTVD